MPDCITVSKIGREERIIYGDTVFNGHILSDTAQAIDLMGNTEAKWLDIVIKRQAIINFNTQ